MVEIAVVCNGGENIIVARDEMKGCDEYEFGTYADRNISTIMKLTKTCALAAVGNASLIEDYYAMLHDEIVSEKKMPLCKIAQSASKVSAMFLKEQVEQAILLPKGIDSITTFQGLRNELDPELGNSIQNDMDDIRLGFEVMLVGVDRGGGHIHEFDNRAKLIRSLDIGYNAIGIGAAHALTSLGYTGFQSSMDLPESLVHIFAAKKAAERAPLVGPGTEVAVIDCADMRFLDELHLEGLESIWLSRKKDFRNWEADMNEVGRIEENVIM